MSYLYRGPQSPRDEQQYTNFSSNPLSPPRNPNRLSGGMVSSNDGRGNLTRRFTMNALPTLSPIGQQRRQAAGEGQMPAGTYTRVTPSERRIRHIETLIEQQRRIAAELDQVDDETKRNIEEGLRHERDVTQMIAQSEPTTPPEYQDSFSNTIPRPNRYSMTSLTSPSGAGSRLNRSSTQLTSPASGYSRPYTATTHTTLPSQSVPASRRQSDDEEEVDDFLLTAYDSALHRAAANPNRNSMPVTSYDRKRNAGDLSSNFGPVNTTSFLFDEDEKPSALPSKGPTKTSPPDTKTYLQMQHTADGFPKLIRRGDNGEPATGSSAALDLALSLPVAEQQVAERNTASRHRISLPPSALSSGGNIAGLNSILANANDAKSAANNRRSMEVKFTAETKRPALMASPPHVITNGVPKAQVSYSTNDIPTLKSINGEHNGGVPITSPPTHPSTLADAPSAEQNSNAISRVNSGSTVINNINRQSKDFNTAKPQENNTDIYSTIQSGQQGGATSFGAMQTQEPQQIQPYASQNMPPPYGQQAYYGGYGMQSVNNGFSNMNLNGGYGGPGQWPNQVAQFQQGGYNGYQQFAQNNQAVAGASRFPENPRAAAQYRKYQAEDAFNSVTTTDLVGQIYSLCKDQHGCRFLQRKLEEQKETDIQIIFDEVKNNFSELMTDPFGNYLCQRLLEYSNDEQRTTLIENAVPAMTKISLNQHGTRALQKMIEFISTEEQTNLIINALRFNVVQLIQDLNGNHVIQKCLNHLSSQDAQFIFDAVAANCVSVGTHRHGCCVLQRCVDHATGSQKGALVDSIIGNAYALVQDPFGNYVVQYIIDLQDPSFTEPLCRSFVGSVAFLSKQKFSSNVIEKCIRCASVETKRLLIQEIAPASEIEKLLRDGYANYVVQTAMDCADKEIRPIIMENIRPMLPIIRHTPYGRRIQSKIQDYDNGIHASIQGHLLPRGSSVDDVNEAATSGPAGAVPASAFPSSGPPTGRGNRSGFIGAPQNWAGNGNGFGPGGVNGFVGGDISAPIPQRNQAYNMLNGYSSFNNYQNYPGPGYRAPPPPPYGHF